jgi:hypothetical protein
MLGGKRGEGREGKEKSVRTKKVVKRMKRNMGCEKKRKKNGNGKR